MKKNRQEAELELSKVEAELAAARRTHQSANVAAQAAASNLDAAFQRRHQAQRALNAIKYTSEFLGRCSYCLDNAFLDGDCSSGPDYECLVRRAQKAHDVEVAAH